MTGPPCKPSRDETLVKALVRAHRWRRKIESGQAHSITNLAEQEGVTVAYVCRLLPLTCLAPDIVEAILDGWQPKGLRVAEMLGTGPVEWDSSGEVWLHQVTRAVQALRSTAVSRCRNFDSPGFQYPNHRMLGGSKAEADGREAEVWPSLSGLCTGAAIVTGTVRRRRHSEQSTRRPAAIPRSSAQMHSGDSL